VLLRQRLLRSRLPPHGTESQEVSLRAARILQAAQDTADRVTTDADAEANKLVTEARENADRTVAEANEEAERTVTNARNEANATLADAKEPQRSRRQPRCRRMQSASTTRL